MYGWRARIGLIAETKENVERSFHVWAPEGVTYTTSRVTVPAEQTKEAMAELADNLVAEAAKFKGYPIDFIIYTPVIGAYLNGTDWEKEVVKRMKEASGAEVISYSMALAEALKALEAKKVFVVSPYTADGNDKEKAFVESNGVEVADIFNMDTSYVYKYGRVLESTDGYLIYRNIQKIDMKDADVLYISSMELATMELINDVELLLDVPVITSHQVALWAALRHCRVGAKLEKAGRLFQL